MAQPSTTRMPSSATRSHQDQRVLITAAASGIGLVTAKAFLAAGARLFFCDVDAAEIAKAIESAPGLAGWRAHLRAGHRGRWAYRDAVNPRPM